MNKMNDKIKKRWLVFLVGLLLGSLGHQVNVSAQEVHLPNFNAESAILINNQNGQILLEQEADKQVEVGDYSKLVLAYLILKAVADGKISLDDEVTISSQAYDLSQNYQVSNVPLRQDYPYQVKELLRMVAMMGANGASFALAQVLNSDIDEVIRQMNQQLRDWQLSEYTLVTVTGLSTALENGQSGEMTEKSPNKISSHNLATIAYRLLHDFPSYEQEAMVENYEIKKGEDTPYAVHNQNTYLSGEWKIEGVKGLGVYDSEMSGYSQVIHYEQNQEEVLAVLLGQKSDDIEPVRFNLVRMLEYGVTAYETKTLLEKGHPAEDLPNIKVMGGEHTESNLVYGADLVLAVPKGDNIEGIAYEYSLDESYAYDEIMLSAPIAANQVVGKVKAVPQRQEIRYVSTGAEGEVPLVQVDEIKELSLIGKVLQTIGNFVGKVIESVRQFFVGFFN